MGVSLLYDWLGAEELGIMIAADRSGLQIDALNAKTLLFSGESRPEYEVYINRCKSAHRRLKVTELLEGFSAKVINSYNVEKNSNDKTLTTLLFNKNNLPTPKTCFIPYNTAQGEEEPFFRKDELVEAARKIIDQLSFPMVIKPLMGSWGKRVRKIEDSAALSRELRHNTPTMINQIGFYVQEFIPKAFDVRGYVAILNGKSEYIASLARVSPSDEKFITNTAQGGMPIGIDAPRDLRSLLIKIAEAVAPHERAALLALDVMPVMDEGEEREQVYALYRQLQRHFNKVRSFTSKFFKGLTLTKERVEAADRWLRGVYEDFMSQETYARLKNLVEDILEEKPILSQEVNSNTDFWFGTRNVTRVNLAEYYVRCAIALGGG